MLDTLPPEMRKISGKAFQVNMVFIYVHLVVHSIISGSKYVVLSFI